MDYGGGVLIRTGSSNGAGNLSLIETLLLNKKRIDVRKCDIHYCFFPQKHTLWVLLRTTLTRHFKLTEYCIKEQMRWVFDEDILSVLHLSLCCGCSLEF